MEELVKYIIKNLGDIFNKGLSYSEFKAGFSRHAKISKISEPVLEMIFKTYSSFYYNSKMFNFIITNPSRPYWHYKTVEGIYSSELCFDLSKKDFFTIILYGINCIHLIIQIVKQLFRH